MFDTPQEAALKAEVARLRAENEYLRRAVEAPSRRITPYGVEDEIEINPSALRSSMTLPLVAGVEGELKNDHRWSVLAWHRQLHRNTIHDSTMRVAYFMDRAADGFDDRVFVNDVLPRMHERFIRQLADTFTGKL